MLSIILIIIIKAIIFNVKIVIIIILMTGRVNGGLIYLGVLGFLGPAPAIASSMFSSFKGKHKRKFAKLIFDTPPPQKKFINFGGQSFFLIGGSLIALPPLLSTLLCALLFTPAGHQHSSCGCICCIFICTCICISIPVRCFPRPAGHQCSICIYICICISICICTLLSAVLFTPAGHQYSICICICITICIRTLL